MDITPRRSRGIKSTNPTAIPRENRRRNSCSLVRNARRGRKSSSKSTRNGCVEGLWHFSLASAQTFVFIVAGKTEAAKGETFLRLGPGLFREGRLGNFGFKGTGEDGWNLFFKVFFQSFLPHFSAHPGGSRAPEDVDAGKVYRRCAFRAGIYSRVRARPGSGLWICGRGWMG